MNPLRKPIEIELPEKLGFLVEKKARYKGAHGGRGSTKSWSFARVLLYEGIVRPGGKSKIVEKPAPLRVLCAREFQNSIDESVHQLLQDQIIACRFEAYYTVQAKRIIGPDGTDFSFDGLHHNAQELKSYEGVDIVWVEEANNVSRSSWNILTPTIRKNDSEIWLTFNPELEEDETYQRFVVNPPADSIVVEMNWRDNPWFNSVLEAERRDLERRDHDEYLTVWEGRTRAAVQGAIYAKEMAAAMAEGRIGRVPYIPSIAVDTFWDLGHSDATAIWMIQRVGFEWNVIDYIEDRLQKLPYYIEELQKRKYIWGMDYMPHDARNEHLAGKSIESQAQAMGRRVEIVPASDVVQGINAVRSVFALMNFDKDKCADGLHALRHYRWRVSPDKLIPIGREPLHDWASHGADALRTFATGFKGKARPKPAPPRVRYVPAGGASADTGWMAH